MGHSGLGASQFGDGGVVTLPACTPGLFPSGRQRWWGRCEREAAAGGCRGSCSLKGALCRARWCPALPGLPRGVPACPCPSVSPSPGHHQGPVPEGEVQPAQGVRGAGLPARHVHQPQEAGAQVGGSAAGPQEERGAQEGAQHPLTPCRIKPLGPKAHGGCKPCHAAPVAAVCGSDGHTYSSPVRTAVPVAGTGLCAPCPPADVPLPPRSASWSSRRAWPASS